MSAMMFYRSSQRHKWLCNSDAWRCCPSEHYVGVFGRTRDLHRALFWVIDCCLLVLSLTVIENLRQGYRFHFVEAVQDLKIRHNVSTRTGSSDSLNHPYTHTLLKFMNSNFRRLNYNVLQQYFCYIKMNYYASLYCKWKCFTLEKYMNTKGALNYLYT